MHHNTHDSVPDRNVVEWSAPEKYIEALRRRTVQEWTRIVVRSTLIVLGCSISFYAWFAPKLSGDERLRVVAASAIALCPVLLIAIRFARFGPRKLRATDKGLEWGLSSDRQRNWKWLSSFEVEESNLAAGHRELVLFAQSREVKRLPLPSEGEDDVIEKVARHLPRHRPTVLRKLPRTLWVTAIATCVGVGFALGLCLPVLLAGASREVVRWVALVMLLGGPGTWWCLVLRGRFDHLDRYHLAYAGNMIALLTAIVIITAALAR